MTQTGETKALPLRDAAAVKQTSAGELQATVVAGWDIFGVPNGGYLMAILASAAGEASPHPDPLTVSATFLSPPTFGPVSLTVDAVRIGGRQSTVEVRLLQDGSPAVHGVVTLGTLPDSSAQTLVSAARPPEVSGPEEFLAPPGQADEGPGIGRHVDMRLGPDTGFLANRTQPPTIDAWLRLKDESDIDPLALLVFADVLPPSIFELEGLQVGHVPTIQLTTHLFARPKPGWIQARAETRVRSGSLVNEDCHLWDSEGYPVATSRQLALARPST